MAFLRPVATQKSRDGVTALVALDEDTIVVARRTTGLAVWKVIIGTDETMWMQHAVISDSVGINFLRKVSSKQIIYKQNMFRYYIYDMETDTNTVLSGVCTNVSSIANFIPSKAFTILDVHSGLVAHQKTDDKNVYVVPIEIAINNDQDHPMFIIPSTFPIDVDRADFDCIILSDCCVVCCILMDRPLQDSVVDFRVYNPKMQEAPNVFSFSNEDVGDYGIWLSRINDTRFAMKTGYRDIHQIWIFNVETGLPEAFFSMIVCETCIDLVALDDHTLVGVGLTQQLFAWTQSSTDTVWGVEYDHYLDLTPLNPDNPEDLFDADKDRQFETICKMSDSRFVVSMNMVATESEEISTIIIMETAKYDPIRQYALRAASVPHPENIMRAFLTFNIFKFIVNYKGYWAPYPSFEQLISDIREFIRSPWNAMKRNKIHLPEEIQEWILKEWIRKQFSLLTQ